MNIKAKLKNANEIELKGGTDCLVYKDGVFYLLHCRETTLFGKKHKDWRDAGWHLDLKDTYYVETEKIKVLK